VTIKRRLARLEKAAATLPQPGPVGDHCPRCGGAELPDPGAAEFETLADWHWQHLQPLYEELAQRAARLAWCPACQCIVPAGRHDPDWRRQFWEQCAGPGLQRNILDLKLIRSVEDWLMNQRNPAAGN
jgi:hypothetical protein